MAQRNCSMRLFCEPAKKNFAVKRKGFTLVELVIVIAVLAIIAAIAIPTVSGVIKNANDAADAANCRQITAVVKTFATELEAKTAITPSFGDTPPSTRAKVSEIFALYGTSLPEAKSEGKFFAWAWHSNETVLKTQAELDADKNGLLKIESDMEMLLFYQMPPEQP